MRKTARSNRAGNAAVRTGQAGQVRPVRLFFCPFRFWAAGDEDFNGHLVRYEVEFRPSENVTDIRSVGRHPHTEENDFRGRPDAVTDHMSARFSKNRFEPLPRDYMSVSFFLRSGSSRCPDWQFARKTGFVRMASLRISHPGPAIRTQNLRLIPAYPVPVSPFAKSAYCG